MDIKELDCFRQYLDTDKIAKKNISVCLVEWKQYAC